MRTYENTIALCMVYNMRLYACIYAVSCTIIGLQKRLNNTRYVQKALISDPYSFYKGGKAFLLDPS